VEIDGKAEDNLDRNEKKGSRSSGVVFSVTYVPLRVKTRSATVDKQCKPMLRSPGHKMQRSTAFHAVLSRAALW